VYKISSCDSSDLNQGIIIKLLDELNNDFLSITINDEKLFIKKTKGLMRREIFVNKLLQATNKYNSIIPKLICILNKKFLVFEYLSNTKFDSKNVNHVDSFISAINLFQNIHNEISFINKLYLILSTSSLQLSALRMSLEILIKKEYSLFCNIFFRLLILISATKKTKKVFIHKDLRRSSNYRFFGTNSEFYFVDLESSTI